MLCIVMVLVEEQGGEFQKMLRSISAQFLSIKLISAGDADEPTVERESRAADNTTRGSRVC